MVGTELSGTPRVPVLHTHDGRTLHTPSWREMAGLTILTAWPIIVLTPDDCIPRRNDPATTDGVADGYGQGDLHAKGDTIAGFWCDLLRSACLVCVCVCVRACACACMCPACVFECLDATARAGRTLSSSWAVAGKSI